MDRKHMFHNLILGIITSCFCFVMYHLIKIDFGLLIVLVFLVTTLLLVVVIYWYNTRYYDRYIKSVTDVSKDLKFKNILYSLLVDSGNIENREEFYDLILNKSIEAIPNADKGSILRLNEDFLLVFEAAKGHDLEILKTVKLYVDQTFLYKRTDGKLDKTTIINDFKDLNEKNLDKDKQETLNGMISEIKTVISTPIWVKNEIWGMINIDSYKAEAFDYSSIESLEIFAKEASKAIVLFDTLEKNSYLVKYDVLTDIYNRAYFNELTYKMLEDDLDKEAMRPASIVSMDLDKFKRINDVYGHQSGDRYLVYFTKVVKQYLGETDIFARYGGDEFIVLMIDRKPEEAEVIMNQITKYFHGNPIELNETKEVIEFSYGISYYPSEGITGKGLLEISDSRMYTNKNSKLTL